jgi:hypothetical protein
MGRTLIRSSRRIRASDTYLDNLPMGDTLETNAVTQEDDSNAERTCLKDIKGTAKWSDPSPVVLANLVATQVGQVLFSVDGASFSARNPIIGLGGWLVGVDGTLLVAG